MMALLVKWAGSRVAGPVVLVAAVILVAMTSTAVISRHLISAKAEALRTDRDAWRTAAGRWESAAAGWRASFEEAERRRSREAAGGVSAVGATLAACDARVEAARRTSRAIQDIITQEITTDETTGCPRRGIVAGDRLRDALRADR